VTAALLEHETIDGSVVAAAVARVDEANALPATEVAAPEAAPEVASGS
jgi:hypothetical protein